MAIIVEEENKSSRGAAVMGWVVLLGIVLVSAYYLFFVPADQKVATPPADLSNLLSITSASTGTLDFASISTQLKAFQESVVEATATAPGSVGRPNPFITP